MKYKLSSINKQSMRDISASGCTAGTTIMIPVITDLSAICKTHNKYCKHSLASDVAEEMWSVRDP